MPDKTPYEQYKEIAAELYRMPDAELGSARAEEIRDQLDPIWHRLTKRERERFSKECQELT